ncbi:MAG: S1 RNA-binding domain-containing protein [Chloroflexi bacterium]|nr:S1 RNA-binding domain-containing protein [Chloroflexota bacterium]
MAALLETEAAQPSSLRRGEIIQGVVMGASPDGVIVDVGTKTEAVIPQSEMLSMGVEGQSRLKAGDTVRVMVLQPMSSEGHGVVSLDRARGEEGWEILAARLESGEIFSAEIVGHNRGGVLANVEGVNAFIPLSQIDSIRRDNPDAASALATLVGKEVRLKVIELNRRKNRAILSERAAMTEWRREQKERIIQELQEGEIREGRISSITDFGVFVDLGGADGLAHLTELTWERGKKAKDLFKVGDEVKAYVLRVDREARKISLSLKRAHPEEWDSAVDRFVIGQVLIGRVTKLMPFGAFVRLDGPIEGLIHISEITNRRIQHPREVLEEGNVVPVKLVRIEKDRHRLGLSLRQARSDAEAMGFGFDRNGSVIDWPDDVREEFGMDKRDASQSPARPRTTQETVEEAVANDPEPVSAFAHAFAQALENADASRSLNLGDEEAAAPAEDAAPEAAAEEAAAPEAAAEEAASEAVAEEAAPEAATEDSAPDAVAEEAAPEAVAEEAAPEAVAEEAAPEAVAEEAAPEAVAEEAAPEASDDQAAEAAAETDAEGDEPAAEAVTASGEGGAATNARD